MIIKMTIFLKKIKSIITIKITMIDQNLGMITDEIIEILHKSDK